jgi:hypothetical protein
MIDYGIVNYTLKLVNVQYGKKKLIYFSNENEPGATG